ncbi:hypothetical protein G7B40_040330 [Aetokthonos hydrillicola Thurmond2011]|jgi:hypothetical protein|uniref:Uncharacterized protein n=1 Tax=Aetokthonos hydrillicola Thurmond2011 TaxID=2712845 RepID=A0AAP5ME95_9CYAN|nr:hypothetical protein [Aetokthonos hydrillicola]MBO3459977.1 hypothetical protein [Aetokthonos hydrillicola CCALA 1050]MBW4584096.1 hypothetical protein [Aetokthonos hydrillicola CCALA 1050]MDR9900738.1 hypothetical protein [Aetokthonos hydrillicola Thurmond2011]
MSEVLWLPTSTVLEKFHPENPREHTEEHDLPWIRDSLLDFGWLAYPTIQQNLDGSLGYLISGHGRTIGADWLSQQDDEFFASEWNRWIKATGRDKIANKHQGRFCADYWLKTPVIPTTLDDLSQKSALLRLNNTSHDGRDDPGKIAAILAQMPKRQIKTAGWDTSTANNFMQAFLQRKEEEPQEEGFDYQEKEYFERPDATDYSSDYSGNTVNVEARGSIDDDSYIPSSMNEVVTVDTTEVTEGVLAEVESANYNPSEEQTRFLVYLNKDVLEEFKELVANAADKLGVSKEGLAQQWRSQTILEAVRKIANQQDA